MAKIDLSVGITAHDEGYLIHKTIRCVLTCMEKVVEGGYNYEIIINVDRGDDVTVNYLKRYENDSRFLILYSDFGDLGLSRNNITKKAKGEFLAFIDADDLVSYNWYIEAIKYLKKVRKELILHPAKELIFGVDIKPVCCNIYNSFDKAGDAMILAGCNRWTSTVVGWKKTFLSHPYMKTGGGYGYEDYFFNTEVIADGIRHEIIDETVMFYRRKRVSLLSRSDADRVIQPYTKLLDLDYLKTIPKPKGAEIFDNLYTKESTNDRDGRSKYQPTNFSKKLPSFLQRPYLAIRNNRKTNALIIPVAKTIKRVLRSSPIKENIVSYRKEVSLNVPDYLIKYWKELNQIEPQLYPRPYILKHEFEFYYTDGLNRRVGPALWYLAQQIPKLPDYIFIVPWLIPGGSEKVLLNYIEALSLVRPEWTIAVVTTEKKRNTWKNKLGKNAYLVDFGNVASKLDEIEKDFLFSRLITQLRSNRLHVIQSDYGYKWMANHAKLIASNYHVNASVFCNGVTNYPDGGVEVSGYIDPRLFEIYDIVEKVFTDNYSVVKYIMELDGYTNDKKFKVHYQPVLLPKRQARRKEKGLKTRILWASRISRQKQPEILGQIAELLEKERSGEFAIDVYGELDKTEYGSDPIGKSQIINKKGGFSSFSEIPTSEYDIFLYTSIYDGLPNIVLEAASVALPIVSSNVGGIGELIDNKKNGVLIDDYKSARAFVDAIEYLADNKDTAESYGEKIRKKIKEKHSMKTFKEVVKRDISNG